MTQDVFLFFHKSPQSLPLYERLEEKILSEIENVTVKVQKTQISFSNKRNFAFASLLPVRKAKERHRQDGEVGQEDHRPQRPRYLGHFGECHQGTPRVDEPCSDVAPSGYSGIPAQTDRGQGNAVASFGLYCIQRRLRSVWAGMPEYPDGATSEHGSSTRGVP